MNDTNIIANVRAVELILHNPSVGMRSPPVSYVHS